MLLLAGWVDRMTGPVALRALHGLKLVAIPIVAQAVIDMAGKLAPDLTRRLVALAAAVLLLLVARRRCRSGSSCAAAFWAHGSAVSAPARRYAARGGARRQAAAPCACLLSALFSLCFRWRHQAMMCCPSQPSSTEAGRWFSAGGMSCCRCCAPGLCRIGWEMPFLAGYGAAQAMPGPLFTLAAYLGALALPAAPVAGGLVALIALSLPGLLLMAGVLPFHARLRGQRVAQGIVAGVNAAVVGLLGQRFIPRCGRAGLSMGAMLRLRDLAWPC
jgi:chromate transporter